MTRCPKAGCGAEIGADGYCTRCGTRPPTIPARPDPPGPAPQDPQDPQDPPQPDPAQQHALPEPPVGDQLAPVLDDPRVPEHKRFCPNPGCRRPVGRARPDRAGLADGFCPQCGTRFSFRPLLRPGMVVGDDQFRVEGAIAHGGLGWIYRAWDCRVPRWVVLKGLIDPDDPDSRQAAVAELAALADASHPNIVTVFTVVTHSHPLTGRDVDYIVMECLSGKSLKQLRQERPDTDPYLPLDRVCGTALEVLAALDHLHVRRGLLYCDVSADNVIDSTSGVKLIDLGAVRLIDDQETPVWGKPGYQDPGITRYGPSVATDLYPVARMMALLSFPFPGFSDDAPIPGPDQVGLLAEHPSFAGLLRRATNPDPRLRFASAAQMAEQLEGVRREIRAAQEGKPYPAASARFGPELRVVGADPDTFPTADPDRLAAALALPDPQVDRNDPHAGLLAAIGTDPEETERVLAALADPSLETRLRVVRARIERRSSGTAELIDALGRELPGDWRIDWYRGLRALVDGAVEPATHSFTAVLDALPGEAAPKLALAQCAAHAGHTGTAARHYATVWRTDRSYVSAAFGLARARFACGEHAAAATALQEVPEGSRYAVPARLCAILIRARCGANGQAPLADFFAAAEQLARLELDDRRRERAVAEVLETVLRWERAGRPWPHGPATPIPATLLGNRLDEHGVRDRLEAAYRELARLAATPAERIALVDRANHRRNRSWT
ncbi:MAG TPA: tetratricopeptide repeat protein [Pseudonocardiaceae bacterium]